MTNIAIFASGNGSNAENIINYFSSSHLAQVTLVLTDNPNAYVLQRADNLAIENKAFSRSEWKTATNIMNFIRTRKINYIVLAGFLCLISSEIIKEFEGRIINIHPALLPKFGGKGMYGMNVHNAVIEAEEKKSGITIHHVNEHYDDGAIIAQYDVEVADDDSGETLAKKIHALEYKYFPKVIEQEIQKLQK